MSECKHDKDIRGKDWAPCDHCPFADPCVCPSRFHQRYCALTLPDAKNSDHWRSHVAGLAPVDDVFVPQPKPERRDDDSLGPLPHLNLPPIRVRRGLGRLRVLFVTPMLFLGGAERHMLALIDHVDKRMVSWTVATLDDGLCSDVMLKEVKSRCPLVRGMEAARQAAQKADLIVFWGADSVLSFLVGLPNRPPAINVVHVAQGWMANPLFRSMGHGSSKIVAVSPLALEVVPNTRRSDAVVIENAVEPSRLHGTRSRSEVRRSWGVSDDDYVVLYLGRLADEKDPDALLRLARVDRSIKIVIVGDGAETARIREAVESEGLDHVHLVGPDTAVGDCYGAADVFILTSLFESFCLSLAEAWTCGLPVISTSVGVARVYPGHVREIPIEASGDVIADAVRADRDDPDGTAKRVDRAMEFARQRFSVERFGKEWTKVIVSTHHELVMQGVSQQPPKRKGCNCGRNRLNS